MKIERLSEVPPIYLVTDLYTQKIRDKVLNELIFLQPKLNSGDQTAPAQDLETGESRTRKTGAFLEECYRDRKYSDILRINRSTYDIIRELNHWYYSYGGEYYDGTLVSYYESNDYYKPHVDKTFISCISWFYKEPKNFTGGDLNIPSLGLKIPCKDNTMIIFPGILTEHSVDEINIIDNTIESGGRFAIAQFINIKDN